LYLNISNYPYAHTHIKTKQFIALTHYKFVLFIVWTALLQITTKLHGNRSLGFTNA